MIGELFTIFSILIGGSFFMRIMGITGWGAPPIGFVTGIIFLVLFGEIQVITGLSITPVYTLLITALIPVSIWIWRFKKGCSVSIQILPALLLGVFTALIVAFLYSANLLNLSPDSYRYAQIGSLIESGNIDVAQPSLLLKRQIAVPMMHASANLSDKLFLTSITPILSLSAAAILAWICRKGLETVHDESLITKVLPITAAMLLLTNQFFVLNAFYVNGHILYAVLLLLIAGCFWLYAGEADVSRTALTTIPLIAIPALVITRPEAPLHIGLTLAPVLVSDHFSRKLKAGLLTALNVSVIVWYGFLWCKFSAADEVVPVSVSGLFSLGIAGFIFTAVLFTKPWEKLSSRLLPALEIFLWLVFLIAALKNQEMFIISISAAVNNVVFGLGLWGYSLIVLGVLFIGVLLFTKTPILIFLRYPVTTFIPMALISAFLRGHPYRVGPFDSFNRMCLHIVPITILFITASAISKHLNGRNRYLL